VNGRDGPVAALSTVHWGRCFDRFGRPIPAVTEFMLVGEFGHGHRLIDHSPRFTEGRRVMPIAGGVALLTIGAILTFAVTGSIRGIDLHAVGAILMAAGAALLLLPLVFGGMSPPKRWSARSRQDAIDEADQGHSAARRRPPGAAGPTRQDRAPH
jgi:hypothetical protein